MANKTDKRFGVVHGAPSQLSSAAIEEGKLYFLAGEADGAIKQGIYGVDGVTTDASGNVTDYNLAMFGCGSVADGSGYGLSQANFTTVEKNKLAAFGEASTYLTTTNASTNYLKIKDASYFRTVKVGTTSIVADSSKDILEFAAGSNVTITPDASNDKITISATDTTYSAGDGISLSNTIFSHADTNTNITSDTTYGPTADASQKAKGTLTFDVPQITLDKFGHVKDVSVKTIKVLDTDTNTDTWRAIKVNGSPKLANNVSTALDLSAGTNINLTESGGKITIATTDVPTTEEMNTAINTALTSALKYKGTVKDGSVLPTSGNKTGDVYVASGAYTTSQNSISYKCETGDLFIYNGSYFDIVNGENQVSDKAVTLNPSTNVQTLTIATVDGTDITVKVPAKGSAYYSHPGAGTATQSLGNADSSITVNPGTVTKIATVYDASFDASGHYKGKVARDISIKITSDNTDEKVKANTSTSTFYLIGQDDSTNGTTKTTYKNASVYVSNGYLYSGGEKVLTGYTETYKGTVTSITPGTGLTNGTTENNITSTGTLNLKIASSSEIGGVKPGTTDASNKIYGVQVNASTGEMTVNVPWTDNNDNTWRDVYVGTTQRLASTNKASLKFVNGTNITATWNSTNKTIQFDASGLATDDEVATAKAEAIAAATIYWETL